MSKHTPGPWYRGGVENSIYIWEEGGSGEFICEVSNDEFDAGSMKANASLIAAAPELLAACQQLLDSLPQTEEAVMKTQGPITSRAIAAARAAIAKAEGSHP